MKKDSLNKYYLDPMMVSVPKWSKISDIILNNPTREDVAGGLCLKGIRCLDIACGEGYLLNNYLYKNYKHLVGIDISAELIKTARSKMRKGMEFKVAEIDNFVESIIQKNMKYDDVYMLAILEHIPWPGEFIQKVSKIMKKTGRVVVEVPNVAWLPHRLNLLRGMFPTTAPTQNVIPGVRDEHIRFFTIKTLDLIFKNAGFKRIHLDCSGRLRNIKNIYPSLLAPDILAVYQLIK